MWYIKTQGFRPEKAWPISVRDLLRLHVGLEIRMGEQGPHVVQQCIDVRTRRPDRDRHVDRENRFPRRGKRTREREGPGHLGLSTSDAAED